MCIGIMKKNILSRFSTDYPEEFGYLGYVAHEVGVEKALGSAGLLFPNLTEVNGAILITENIGSELQVNTRYGDSIQIIESYNNLICLSDYFAFLTDYELLQELASVLSYSWKIHLKAQFPNKSFTVQIGDGLHDESGLCITFHQVAV